MLGMQYSNSFPVIGIRSICTKITKQFRGSTSLSLQCTIYYSTLNDRSADSTSRDWCRGIDELLSSKIKMNRVEVIRGCLCFSSFSLHSTNHQCDRLVTYIWLSLFLHCYPIKGKIVMNILMSLRDNELSSSYLLIGLVCDLTIGRQGREIHWRETLLYIFIYTLNWGGSPIHKDTN